MRARIGLLEEGLRQDLFPPRAGLGVHDRVEEGFEVRVEVLRDVDDLLPWRRERRGYRGRIHLSAREKEDQFRLVVLIRGGGSRGRTERTQRQLGTGRGTSGGGGGAPASEIMQLFRQPRSSPEQAAVEGGRGACIRPGRSLP